MFTIFFRTAIAYIVVIFAIKLMGKREIGELQLPELVTMLLISELAAYAVADDNIPLLYALIPVVVLAALEVVVSFLVTKFNIMRRLVGETASILIEHGVIRQAELSKVRLAADELFSQLRLKDVFDLSKVDYAIMEPSGKISVLLRAAELPPSCADMSIVKEETGVCFPVVVNGGFNQGYIRAAGRTPEWVREQLNLHGILAEQQVYIMTCDCAGNVTIITKDEETSKSAGVAGAS